MADTPTQATLMTEIGQLFMEAARLSAAPQTLAQFIDHVNKYNADVALVYPPTPTEGT